MVILDLVMPGLDGIGVLKAMRERGIHVPVIVQTAQGGIETVVSAMRHGAFDFVVKPASPDRLQTSIGNALKVEAVEGEVKRTSRRRGGHLTFKDMITHSPAMDRVIRLGQKAAASNIPILIEGESGVGKELVARAIQGSGDRRSKPFVTVNCGAIPDNLVEIDPVRPREGLVHRRHRKAHRQVRRGAFGHAVSRRDRRPAARRAGQAACAPCRTARSIRSAAVRPSGSTSG